MKKAFELEATGTSWNVEIESTSVDVEILNDKVRKRIEVFEQTYSRFRDSSLVSTISKNIGLHKFPEDAKELFETYSTLNKLTDGLFTPLIGQTLEEAGYDSKYSLKSLRTLSEVPKMSESIVYHYPNLEIKMPVKLDFGAGGKGYIIDIVGKLLTENGVENFCIDAGGDILYKNVSNELLRVGLEDPTNPDQAIGIVSLENGSLCGSSGNRRKWGKYNHIINPKTLESSEDILAVWTTAKSALVADSIATCLFFVKPETLKDGFDFEYLILRNDFSIEKSVGFEAELFDGFSPSRE